MKIAHTPGQWHVVHHRPNLFKVETNRVVICDTFGGLSDETLSNAHLIAAAPDLLEALSDIFGHAERTDAADLAELWGRMDDIRDLARAAIAKTKGGVK